MKAYEKAEIDIVLFNSEDIIVTSGTGGGGSDTPVIIDPDD